MMLETKVKKQGNSNVIILPKMLGLKEGEKVRVLIIPNNVTKVKDAAGLFRKELKNKDTDKTLREVKKELWGEEGVPI